MYRKKMMTIFAIFVVVLVGLFVISSKVMMKNADADNGMAQIVNPDDPNAPKNVDYPGKGEQVMNHEQGGESLPEADNADVDTNGIAPVISDQRPGATKSIGRHYLDKVTGNQQLFLWNTNSFPLTIYIQNETGLPERYADGIRTGFSNWQNALNQFVTFTYVNSPNFANIVVSVVQQPIGCGSQDENGSYSFGYVNNKLSNAYMQISQTHCNGSPISASDVYAITQHQIGHILGINGHSEISTDVMFTKNSYENVNISSSDVETLKLLYKFAPDVTNVPYPAAEIKKMYKPAMLRGKNLSEINNYLNSQGEGKNDGLNPLDIAIKSANNYYKTKNYVEALKSYRKALGYAEDVHSKSYIYYSMAVTDIGIGNMEEALNFASQAYQAVETPSNAYLIAYINFQMGQEQKAQEQLEYIIQNYPKLRNAYSLLGQIYVKNKQTEKLRDLTKKARDNFYENSPIKVKG